MRIPLEVLQKALAALQAVEELPCDTPVKAELWAQVLHARTALAVRVDRIMRELPEVEVTQ